MLANMFGSAFSDLADRARWKKPQHEIEAVYTSRSSVEEVLPKSWGVPDTRNPP